MIKPLVEGAINLIVSLISVKYLGLFGVFLGTFISLVCGSLWVDPYVIFKKWFKKPVYKYFVKYIIMMVITFGVGTLSYYLCSLVTLENIYINFVVRFVVICCLPLPLILLSTIKMNGSKMLYQRIKSGFNKLKIKLKRGNNV